MKMKVLAEDVSTVAASASVALTTTPFCAGAGRKATVIMLTEETDAAAADQVGNIQGSEDDSSWSNVQAYNMTTGGVKMVEVLMYPYMRVNNTAGTSGATSFYLLN